MTQEQINCLIAFFSKAGLHAREQEGEVWITDGNGHTTAIIEKGAVICPFPAKGEA